MEKQFYFVLKKCAVCGKIFLKGGEIVLEEFEYTCAPKTNIKRASLLTAACLVTGAIIYCFSFEQTVLSPWFRVIGAVFFMAAVLLTFRFFGTRYIYRLVIDHRGGSTFTVYELRGYFGKENNVRGSGAVCRVDALDILSLVDSTDKKGIRALKKGYSKEKSL